MKSSIIVALSLCLMVPILTANAKDRAFPERCGCGVDVPSSWKVAKPDPNKPRKVKMTFAKGGSFIISSRERKIPLDQVVAATLKTAGERGWKVIKQTKERIASNDGVRLVVEVPTQIKGLVTKQVLYFFNTDNGYRTLHFTAPRAGFNPSQWTAIAQTYRGL